MDHCRNQAISRIDLVVVGGRGCLEGDEETLLGMNDTSRGLKLGLVAPFKGPTKSRALPKIGERIILIRYRDEYDMRWRIADFTGSFSTERCAL